MTYVGISKLPHSIITTEMMQQAFLEGGCFMDKSKLVITIERQYGSGGRIVGKLLAKELGIPFYDDEILRMTAERSAVGEQYFRLADENGGIYETEAQIIRQTV